ncbi:abscisic acid-deficient protein Aba4 family protein [Erythrobacter sp. W302b]|uniref:abscisic acid-deficient protein Aba4 family protein n=1 Tax=Erythrobacter sp. W302b TaxID=3389874 RepID=UPI00396AF5B2
MIGTGLFALWGNAVLLAWTGLALSAALPRSVTWGKRLATISGFYAPAVLSICWAVLLVAAMTNPGAGDLFTLDGVVARFADRDRLMLLYFESLTFSLFVGGWIVSDASEKGVPRIAMILVLPLQFLFGPAGVASYVVVRKLRTKTAC